MLESKIQTEIIHYLESNGYLVVKHIQTNRNGFPDLQALKDGQSIFIEIKRPNGKLSELQKYRLQQLTDKGFKCFIITSINQLLNELSNHSSSELPKIRTFNDCN